MRPTGPRTGSRFSHLTVLCGFAFCFLFTGCLHSVAPIDPRHLPVNSTVAQQLQRHVTYLAAPERAGRHPGSPGNREAAHYIEEQFLAAGLQPLPSLAGYRQPISPQIGDNILGYIPAAEDPIGWILIGAHYDHLGGFYLGADDNASSVAILIEAARMARALPHHAVLFIAFNSEEAPYFGTPVMGSQFFFHHVPREIGTVEQLQCVIIMDLMGGVHWPGLKDAIFATGAEKTPAFYRRVKEAAAPSLTVYPLGIHLVEEIPDHGHEAFSDYDVFRNHGIPYLFLSAGRTPRYHTPRDTADSLHYERMAATTEWFRRLTESIGQDEGPYRFEVARVEFADEVASFRRIVEKAVGDETVIPGTSRWSLRKLRQDAEWLRVLDGSPPTAEQLERLERISIRVQCLLADYAGCFLL